MDMLEELARIDALVAKTKKIDAAHVYGTFFIRHSKSLRQQLASQPSGEPVRPDSDDFLRISKSGYSVKVGWNTEKRIVAKCPYEFNDMKGFQVWLEDAERLCDGWNRTTPPSVDVLVEALRPFAEFAQHYPLERKYGNRPNFGVVYGMQSGDKKSEITVEDFHRAKDALATYSKPITEDKDNG